MTQDGAAIEARDLTKTYGKEVRALDGLGFTVEAGTVFGLLGPNGAGKSTTVKILTTLTRPDSGQASVAGVDVLASPDRVRRAIGLVAQRSGVDLEGTGRENLVLQGQVYGLRGAELRTRAGELLERFGLAEAADRVARGYSGGMQRRLDIAMGLVHRPRVLFLDEPTTGLDPEVRADMWAEIAQLSGNEGLTILLTTHYLEEADRLADRLAIVDRGRVVAEGTPDELKGELRGDAIQVELGDPQPDGQASAALDRVPGVWEVTVEGRSLRARTEDGATAMPTLLKALEGRHGVRVSSVTMTRPSLDDVYLHHTGRSLTRPRSTSRDRGCTMSTTLTHSWFMTTRHLRNLARQPWWIAITLVQPVIWLLLFGAVFKATADIPGFAADSYVDFLTPGIVVMTAAFAGGWAGMGVIEDLNRGVIDRFLVSPVRRPALITGRLVQLGIVSLIQSLIVIGLGLLIGARFPGGVIGLAVLVGCSALLGGSLGALSNGMALLARKEETVIAASNFVLLPLTFLSSAFMQRDLVPGWIQSVARYNPVEWTVQAGGEALIVSRDWGLVLSGAGLLAALCAACTWLATRAFRSYQRSI